MGCKRYSVASILLTVSFAGVAVLFNHIVPEPYMDEIFHVPQAQQYCHGDFIKWDPMITTFPGLYLLSTLYANLRTLQLHTLPWMHGNFDHPSWYFTIPSCTEPSSTCSVPFLRSLNVLLGAVCFILLHALADELSKDPRMMGDHRSRSWGGGPWAKATALALFPLHWFFSFLYYTDVGSTTAVLAAYLACLKHHYWTCALLAGVGVAFRQTNAVWALFFACVGAMELLEPQAKDRQKSPPEPSAPGTGHVLHSREVSVKRRGQTQTVDANADKLGRSEGMVRDQNEDGVVIALWRLAWRALARWQLVLLRLGPLLAVVVAFVVFVIRNGGVVVGAHDSHKMSLHFAQLLYFLAFSAAALWPVHFTPQRAMAVLRFSFSKASNSSRPLSTLTTLIAIPSLAFFAVHKFSLAHPYLLADNRHYTFYVWRRIIGRHWTSRYALIPLYLYSATSVLQSLRETRNALWIFFYAMATSAVLVLSPLIEFRYFTVPFMLLALHTPMHMHVKGKAILLIIASFVVVNAFVTYVFLFRPFHWKHDPDSVQRIMW